MPSFFATAAAVIRLTRRSLRLRRYLWPANGPLVSYRPCDSPDIARISFQDLNLVAIVRKFIASGKTRRPRSDNNYPLVVLESHIIFLGVSGTRIVLLRVQVRCPQWRSVRRPFS